MSTTVLGWLFGGASFGRSSDAAKERRARTTRPHTRDAAAHAAETDDDYLATQARAGDVAAFEQLFRRYHPQLVQFAVSYVGSVDDADEIVAEVFTRVWAHRTTWVTKTGVSAYLFGAVRNRALNVIDRQTRARRRSTAFRERGETPGAGTPSPGVAEQIERHDRVVAALRLIAKLPERRRLILSLRWKHGLAWDDIATVLGVSTAAVQREHSRVLANLRAELRDV